MGLFEGRARMGGLPGEVRAAVPVAPGDKVLAWAVDLDGGGHVVVTRQRLVVVDGGGDLQWARAWHEVDQGTWQPESEQLTITWADGRTPARWRIRHSTLFQQALRERVQASVVLAEEFRTESRRRVRVAIRRNLATGAFIEQVMGGRGVDVTDPDVSREAADRLRQMRSEIGL